LKTYLARNRVTGSYPSSSPNKILASWQGSLFNYFFANCWVDLRGRGPDRHPSDPRNLWQNDKFAVIANRQFCINHASGSAGGSNAFYATYGENAWGLTACDNLVSPDYPAASEYWPFGALPTEEYIRKDLRPIHAGTIAVYGAASSINFFPGRPSPRSGMILKYQNCGVRSSALATPTALTRIMWSMFMTRREIRGFATRIF